MLKMIQKNTQHLIQILESLQLMKCPCCTVTIKSIKNRKTKISGLYLVLLPRYEHFNYYGFFNSADLFLSLYALYGVVLEFAVLNPNRWNFCNIYNRSRDKGKTGYVIFNRVLTVYKVFFNFL